MQGFVAYPEGSKLVTDCVLAAVERANRGHHHLTAWQKLRIAGFKLDDLIREKIEKADVLIADLTHPNHNVFYEIGYAVAKGKPVLPTINTSLHGAIDRVQKIGLFDTVGWASYNNSNELLEQIDQWESKSWVNRYQRKRDFSQPLFILDTFKKTEFRNNIFHTVENAHVNYRKFDPVDVPRLTIAQAISEVSASAGVIIPILSSEIIDSELHNLRAAFLLGMAHGYDVEPLAIQYENSPAPIDYRDFIRNSTFRRETERHVSEYCSRTLILNQTLSDRDRQPALGILGAIDLGSPTAENETQQLKYYFVKTAEYSRALRAEGAVVTGRKGSGKSAVYLQVAEASTKDRRRCVVDLRPASHNLSEMREALLSIVNAGVFDHTIAAFWQYIIYVEVLLKIRELALPASRNDFALQERIAAIETSFSFTESMVAGDFTSRLDTATREVIRIAQEVDNAADLRGRLTNMMFEDPIPRLRDAIVGFRDHVDGILVLIDDLDKGWPPRRVETQDVVTVKHLFEVLNKIQRDLTRKRMDFKHLVFLRSDIYEKLVEVTSDRGKYNLIKVDWSDREQLRHLLRQRVISNVSADKNDSAWAAINPVLENGREAIDVMIESSLRRPRFLIDLCERTLSCAVNRGHWTVESVDVDEGLRQMSLYLVSDFGYEMRDIAGTPEDIFYLFIGKAALLTEEELEEILSPDKLGLGVDDTVDLLLWYGFLGVIGETNEPVYIYDREYDFRRLEAERAAAQPEVLYAVNPAFLRGLQRG